MPPRKETSPVVLEQRKLRKREKHRLQMAKYRARAKETVAELLNTALATVENPQQPRSEAQGLAVRTAQAVLRGSLARHAITTDRIVRTISEGLDSTKLKEIDGLVTTRPAMQERLRACDHA